MRAVGMLLLVVVMLTALGACDANDDAGGSTGWWVFRNLGKRADTNLGAQRGAVTTGRAPARARAAGGSTAG